MDYIIQLLIFIYAYCADFTILVANYTDTSYYEVNFLIFIVLYPLLIIVSPLIYLIQRYRLRKIKKLKDSIHLRN